MKSIVIAGVLLAGLFKCGGQEKVAEYVPVGCNTTVSVVDFTGLDGCGLMLVLEDGSRLIPERRVYIQAPKIEDDPIYYHELVAGQKLRIAYKETDMTTVCMAGKSVFVTCITKID
jgi:hypothetical protein